MFLQKIVIYLKGQLEKSKKRPPLDAACIYVYICICMYIYIYMYVFFEFFVFCIYFEHRFDPLLRCEETVLQGKYDKNKSKMYDLMTEGVEYIQ